MTLGDWAALGYKGAPRAVDNIANGGNGDGIVCGNDIGKKDPANPSLQLYLFRDNNVPG